jgi:hypothetical protein
MRLTKLDLADLRRETDLTATERDLLDTIEALEAQLAEMGAQVRHAEQMVKASYAEAEYVIGKKYRADESRREGELQAVLEEASIFCLGCAKKEAAIVPSRSGIVGLAAVHSSGMICLPNTIRALLKERAAPAVRVSQNQLDTHRG